MGKNGLGFPSLIKKRLKLLGKLGLEEIRLFLPSFFKQFLVYSTDIYLNHPFILTPYGHLKKLFNQSYAAVVGTYLLLTAVEYTFALACQTRNDRLGGRKTEACSPSSDRLGEAEYVPIL